MDLYKEKFKCCKCKDTGFVFVNGKAQKCECYDLTVAENAFRASGIKDTQYTFSNYEECNDIAKTIKRTAIDYYKNFDKIVLDRHNSIAFLGQVGCGKTHITVALGLNLLKQKQIQVVYFSYRDVIATLKRYVLDDENYTKKISRYQNAKVLLIDDLLKGKITEADKNILFEIINYRYINNLPIVVSSEFNINDLLSFDEAIGSRIYEMCKNYYVEIDKDINNNYRLK